jgi:hypothetical protein
MANLENGDLKLVGVGKDSAPFTSFSSNAGYGGIGWSYQEEQYLVRKFDWRILPGLSCLYLLCFLDRTYVFTVTCLIVVISEMQGK